MAEHREATATPVVVVGEGLNCLGIIRSLAVAGVPVVAVTTAHRSAVSCTRLARVHRVASLHSPGLVAELKSLGAQFAQRPVLMLGGDRQVALVSRERAELEPWFRIGLPPEDTVRTMADKALFHEFAQGHGLPVPRAVILEDMAGLQRLGELALPLVLKPSDKAHVLEGHADRAVCVHTLAAARDTAARMVAATGSVIAQEWIAGDDKDIFFALFVCDSDSRFLGLFCGRKLVCTPPHVGSTAICAPAGAEAVEIARLAAQYVAAARYRGIGGIEFKRDARTGRFLIVEPTVGRTDWQSEVASLNGVNLPLLAMYDALGQRAGVGSATAGRAIHGEPGMPGAHAASAAAADTRMTAWRASAGFRRPSGPEASGMQLRDGYFRLHDPVPALYHYVVEAFVHRLERRLARLFRTGPAPRAPDVPVPRRMSPP